MTEKIWNINRADPEKTNILHEALRIHPTLCGLLVQRGIETYQQSYDFFRPSLSSLHDPWLMKDMEKAVARIIGAMAIGEKILVYGDYDVDGTSAVACMYSFLKELALPDTVSFYIPHRYREGYGVSKAGIDFARDHGYTLIIALDCGIKSCELIAYARSLGIGFIVCDHHLPDEQLPEAFAILNPKQPGCDYPFKELCGCGVGFKLITALAKRLSLPDEKLHRYLDLVAIAIAADIVSLQGENRVLAFYGLQKANADPNCGIRALRQLSGVKKNEFDISDLVFLIAPRINAAGRMDDATKAVLMFTAGDYQEALSYARLLHADNSDRKEADSSITMEALQLIRDDAKLMNSRTTVLYQEHWHKGVVGIVASRLIEHFYRPTIVLTRSGELVAGSARSVAGFNVYEAIHECRELLLGYGGHFYAAGMTMSPDNVIAFREKFEEVVSGSILPSSLAPELSIDAELSLQDLTSVFYKILCQMEPFGPDNPKPLLLISRLRDTGNSRIIKDQHLRFSVRDDHTTINGIGFNMAEKSSLLLSGEPVDIVFNLEENEWNGQKSLQMKVVDFAKSKILAN